MKSEDCLNVNIGIDIGTSYLSYAVSYRHITKEGDVNESFEVIPNNYGERVTPSYAILNENQCVIGKIAKQSENKTIKIKHPNKKIYEKIIEEVIQNIMIHFNRNINVNKIIFSVPSYYSSDDKKVILDLGKNVEVVDEAIASFLYYKRDIESNSKNLLIDIGGGSMKISYLTVKSTDDMLLIDVGYRSHIENIGGEKFDDLIVNYCIEKFNAKYNEDCKYNKVNSKELRNLCEMAKMRLSYENSTLIEIDKFYHNKDLMITITKETFEDISKELSTVLRSSIREFIISNNISHIDNILLIGGCIKIPKVYNIIESLFSDSHIIKSLNPDEANSIGSSLYNKQYIKSLSDHPDEIPFAIGIRTEGNLMSVVVPKGTKLPVKSRKNFLTTEDNQTNMNISIFIGDNPFVKDNVFIKKVKYDSIPPMPSGTFKIDFLFKIDVYGNLYVSLSEIDNSVNDKTFKICNIFNVDMCNYIDKQSDRKSIEDVKFIKKQLELKRKIMYLIQNETIEQDKGDEMIRYITKPYRTIEEIAQKENEINSMKVK